MAKKPAKPAGATRQDRYAAAKRAAGEHVKLTVNLKAAEDVAALKALRQRFSDLSDNAIGRLALRELAAKKNRR